MSIKRQIAKPINEYKKKYPVLAITGPRQSGKTTLLKTLFKDYSYVSLENPDMRAFATADPNGFLNEYNQYVILDEVQQVPELFSYIQTIVDQSGIMGQYILSGSQNFQLMHRITQSLAGRVAIFKLLPLDISELHAAKLLPTDYSELMLRGCYPALYDRNISSKTFYANYIQTYIERDVSDLVNIRDTRLFKNFLGLCASRAGQMLNLNALANECGISQPTAKAWLAVLESSYIVFQLPPYFNNFSKRVVKTPKLYFYDTGLLAHLLKLNNSAHIKQLSAKGMLFENMMMAEYVKRNHHQYLHQDFWYWRDSAGHEVDLLIQNDEHFNAIEIKCTETVLPEYLKGLSYFADIAGNQLKSQSLLYAGNRSQERSKVHIIAWKQLYQQTFK
jgi:predicted AAA+ superfamily ATPase